jgi:hypothetical protein
LIGKIEESNEIFRLENIRNNGKYLTDVYKKIFQKSTGSISILLNQNALDRGKKRELRIV